ncbi:hypothetical protein G7Y89_g110 [Cudoniella acicularis]|uniref:DNA2/NAM7 helicase-like C-terminal domain-containing protein n=1 Tax=Cudoniella acicularis TaxID=354080 RepID=A0A8H4W975_9HELO|nr:hypothetical protein G7Y89_g110 [Cudoniella acicularis]
MDPNLLGVNPHSYPKELPQTEISQPLVEDQGSEWNERPDFYKTPDLKGHFGLQSNKAIEQQKLIAHLITADPMEGIPYVGIIFQFPRNMEGPERYGRLDPVLDKDGNAVKGEDGRPKFSYSTKHNVDVRFYSDTINLRIQPDSAEFKEKLFSQAQRPVPEEDICIVRINVRDGAEGDIYHERWLYKVTNSEATDFKENHLADCLRSRGFYLCVPNTPSTRRALEQMDYVFGEHGLFEVTWNKEYLTQFNPMQPRMTECTKSHRYHMAYSDIWVWYINVGFGSAQDALGLIEFCDLLQKIPVLAQFIHEEDNENKFTASIETALESIFRNNRFIEAGQKIKIYFEPKEPDQKDVPTIIVDQEDAEEDNGENGNLEKASNTEQKPNRIYWEATVLKNTEITHPGAFLNTARLKSVGRDGHVIILDTREVTGEEEYNVDLEAVPIYLEISESATTVRRRIAALNEFVADLRPTNAESAARNRKSNNVNGDNEETNEAHLEGEAQENEDGEVQINPLAFLAETPINFRDQRALVISKILEDMWEHDFVHPLSPKQFQELLANCTPDQKASLEGYFRRVPQGICLIKGPAGTGKSFLLRKAIEIQLVGRKTVLLVASSIQTVNMMAQNLFEQFSEGQYLMVCAWTEHIEADIVKKADAGLINTTNPKLLALRPKHEGLANILNISGSRRSPEQRKDLPKLIKAASRDVRDETELFMCTTTIAGSSFVKPYVKSWDVVGIDDACCSMELEYLLVVKGNKPTIMAADPEQLPPPIYSELLRNPDGTRYNSFTDPIGKSLMRRLLDLDRPFIDCDTQIHVSTNGLEAPEDSPKLGASPIGLVYPVMIDVRNSFTFKEVGGTSKGNTATAYFTLKYIRKMREALPSVQNSDFVVVIPYVRQRKIYVKQILYNPAEFAGIIIATTNTYQGWENKFVFNDFTSAENLKGKAGFVTNKHRLAVALTRTTQFMACVGDSKCTIVKNDDDSEVNTSEDQAELDKKYDLNQFRELFAWFSEHGRVIHENALRIDPSCTFVPQVTQESWKQQMETMNKRQEILAKKRQSADDRWGSGGAWGDSGDSDAVDHSHGSEHGAEGGEEELLPDILQSNSLEQLASKIVDSAKFKWLDFGALIPFFETIDKRKKLGSFPTWAKDIHKLHHKVGISHQDTLNITVVDYKNHDLSGE